jgi:hypothetical protein
VCKLLRGRERSSSRKAGRALRSQSLYFQLSIHLRRRSNTASEASAPASISVISDAAKNFGSPDAQAIQLAVERQKKTNARKPVLSKAAIRAQATPRSMSDPHTADNAPKVPPEMSAVLAVAGLER